MDFAGYTMTQLKKSKFHVIFFEKYMYFFANILHNKFAYQVKILCP